MAIKDTFARLKNMFSANAETESQEENIEYRAVEHRDMEDFIQNTVRISHSIPVKVTIHDNIEGNVTFTFKMTEGESGDSFTSIKATDDHHAEITITNVRGYGVRYNNTKVGTFRGHYDLYLSFVLFKENTQWFLEYTFCIIPQSK